jgi:hypothetical protein
MSIEHLDEIKVDIDEKYLLLYKNQRSLNRLSADERGRIELKNADLRREIKQCEIEILFWLRKESADATFAEDDAQVVIDALIEETKLIEESSVSSFHLKEESKKIREKAIVLGDSASVKIKPVINLLPPSFGFVIEGELDAKSFIVKNFDSFKRLIQNSKK